MTKTRKRETQVNMRDRRQDIAEHPMENRHVKGAAVERDKKLSTRQDLLHVLTMQRMALDKRMTRVTVKDPKHRDITVMTSGLDIDEAAVITEMIIETPGFRRRERTEER